MSHSKQTKRGFSLYLNKWQASEKKYINTCGICGRQGYSPVIETKDFFDPNSADYSHNRVVYRELTKTLQLLSLDDEGRCSVCAAIQSKYFPK